MSKAIVLLSGGIDSTTCLAKALKDNEDVDPVHINYGQQTSALEAHQARRAVWSYQKDYAHLDPLEIIPYEDVFSKFAAGVASDRDSFVNEDGSMNEEDGRSTGYVPMRNLILISTAAAIADSRDADAVYHGAQMGDEADYPDCRPVFMSSVQDAINQSLPGTKQINLRTPLIYMPKPDVIEYGEELGVPWEFTYSCYEAVEDLEDPQPCGNCPACVERAEAFREAGVDDPFGTIEMVERHDGKVRND